jgi:acyl-CoA synthetase (AMP-forming)/AMP-acid ligase II
LTEEIVVVVEMEKGAASVETLVKAAVLEALGIVPDRVLIQEPRTIPRTSNGKIRHAALRDQLTPRSARNSPSVISEGDSSR